MILLAVAMTVTLANDTTRCTWEGRLPERISASQHASHPAEVARLASLLESGTKHERQAAAESLGAVGDLKGLPVLIVASLDENKHIATAAIWSIGRFRDPRAVSALLTALESRDEHVQQAAACGLGRIGDESVLTHLERFRASRNPFVASAVRWSAGNIKRAVPPSSRAITIEHVTLIDGTGALPRSDMTIVIEGSRITRVGRSRDIRPRGSQIDGTGLYAIPGLWDMHLHMSRVEDLLMPMLLAHGITSVRDMGDGCAQLRAIRDSIRNDMKQGPRIYMAARVIETAQELALHERLQIRSDSLGLPRIVTKEPGCDRIPVGTAAEAAAAVDLVLAEGADFIKARNFVDSTVYFAIASAAKTRGVTFAAHPPYAIGAVASASAGTTTLEHGFYPWPPASISATERRALLDTWRRVGTALVPTFITWESRAIPIDSVLAEMNDPNPQPGSRRAALPDEIVQRWRSTLGVRLLDSRQNTAGWREVLDAHMRDIGEMYRAGVRILPGTDGPNNAFTYPGSSLIDELELFVKGAGLSPMEAIVAGTRQSAEAMGLDDLGTLSPGKLADIVLLGGDPLAEINNLRQVRYTIVNGRVIFVFRTATRG